MKNNEITETDKKRIDKMIRDELLKQEFQHKKYVLEHGEDALLEILSGQDE